MQLSRWNALLDKLQLAPDDATFAELERAYREPHRHYHNVQHIGDCLQQLDQVVNSENLCENITGLAEIELALWFHDAIYKIGSSRNELDSARWAVEFLQQAGADARRCKRIYDSIMATCHDASPPSADAALVVDIDLSILGSEPDVYEQFEINIRNEYKSVPNLIFRPRRRKILQFFLDRESIYFSEPMRARFEQAARRNLSHAIEKLK